MLLSTAATGEKALERSAKALADQEDKSLSDKAVHSVKWQSAPPPPIDRDYRRLPPAEFGPNWPSPVAESQPWIPQMLDLRAESVGGANPQGAVRLLLVHDDRKPCEYSKGPVDGMHYLETISHDIVDDWTGKVMSRYSPRRWTTIEPGVGEFRVYLTISREDADWIQKLEEEHLEDFELAWKLSVQKVADHVQRLSPGPLDDVLARLVDGLVSVGDHILIPQEPDVLAQWGPRLKAVYMELAYQSATRDSRREHTPKSYIFTWIGAEQVTDPYRYNGTDISVQFEMPVLHKNSPQYIHPGLIKPVFGFSSYAEYKSAKGSAAT